MKILYDGRNVWSHKIIMLDDAHHLLSGRYGCLGKLSSALRAADHVVLGAFTATAFGDGLRKGTKLLSIVKGMAARVEDACVCFSVADRPFPLFPRVVPSGIAEGILHKDAIKTVRLRGASLMKYMQSMRAGADTRRLQNYCNIVYPPTTYGRPAIQDLVRKDAAQYAPKLKQIVDDIVTFEEKAVVIISLRSGYRAMLALVTDAAAVFGFNVATMRDMHAFNHAFNSTGEVFRVLVADSDQCSEGISFFAVRQLFLADVPRTYGALIQRVGRVVRMFSHASLPCAEQRVHVHICVATLPGNMRSADELAVKTLQVNCCSLSEIVSDFREGYARSGFA
jgi:hypothetical protein